jgi:acyl-CoA synthetase (AMP-forming)/AMP-acid ligase II
MLRPGLARQCRHSIQVFSHHWQRKLALSAVSGSIDRPLDSRTLPQFFDEELANKLGSHPALICLSEKPRAHGGPVSTNMGIQSHLAWDFQEFDRHIQAVARGLLAMGVKKGDRVAVIMGNTRRVLLVNVS